MKATLLDPTANGLSKESALDGAEEEPTLGPSEYRRVTSPRQAFRVPILGPRTKQRQKKRRLPLTGAQDALGPLRTECPPHLLAGGALTQYPGSGAHGATPERESRHRIGRVSI